MTTEYNTPYLARQNLCVFSWLYLATVEETLLGLADAGIHSARIYFSDMRTSIREQSTANRGRRPARFQNRRIKHQFGIRGQAPTNAASASTVFIVDHVETFRPLRQS
jgi:hypothetical protein